MQSVELFNAVDRKLFWNGRENCLCGNVTIYVLNGITTSSYLKTLVLTFVYFNDLYTYEYLLSNFTHLVGSGLLPICCQYNIIIRNLIFYPHDFFELRVRSNWSIDWFLRPRKYFNSIVTSIVYLISIQDSDLPDPFARWCGSAPNNANHVPHSGSQPSVRWTAIPPYPAAGGRPGRKWSGIFWANCGHWLRHWFQLFIFCKAYNNNNNLLSFRIQ